MESDAGLGFTFGEDLQTDVLVISEIECHEDQEEMVVDPIEVGEMHDDVVSKFLMHC